MRFGGFLISVVVLLCSYNLTARQLPDSGSFAGGKQQLIHGFIRGGAYGDLKDQAGKPFISSIFSDIGIKIESPFNEKYKAYADIRFRYGSEFTEPVQTFNVREAYVALYGKKTNISFGQQILKWGRADFTNPTSKLNPQNYISRTIDREDMDLGNIILQGSWHPARAFSLQAVVVPFYRSSTLIIDPIPLPENTTVNLIEDLVTDRDLISYGIRTDLHLRGIDIGASWFEGYDPMPGTALTAFSADFSGPVPVLASELSMTPYKIRMLGFDFEASAGNVGLRGEAAWSVPDLSYLEYEYVPLPEIKWVLGADIGLGNWRLTGEYSGKIMTDYTASPVDPIFGTEPDYAKLAELLADPEFDLHEYVRLQTAAFNRLYNYQLEKSYHSGGIRIESDMLYGKLLPSVFTMYNFTTGDLSLIPEIKVKPLDGLTITAGAEIFSGRKGSLYDIVDDFMTSIYLGIKVEF